MQYNKMRLLQVLPPDAESTVDLVRSECSLLLEEVLLRLHETLPSPSVHFHKETRQAQATITKTYKWLFVLLQLDVQINITSNAALYTEDSYSSVGICVCGKRNGYRRGLSLA